MGEECVVKRRGPAGHFFSVECRKINGKGRKEIVKFPGTGSILGGSTIQKKDGKKNETHGKNGAEWSTVADRYEKGKKIAKPSSDCQMKKKEKNGGKNAPRGAARLLIRRGKKEGGLGSSPKKTEKAKTTENGKQKKPGTRH